jgi:hypothetical protein
MKAASLAEIKYALQNTSNKDLITYCLRLSKYRQENKELLTYLLFESSDEQTFIRDVKEEIDQQFSEINYSSLYYIRKSIRKILRHTNKHIKFSSLKRTEVELLLYFCQKTNAAPFSVRDSVALRNLYDKQLQKSGNRCKVFMKICNMIMAQY